MPDDPRSLVRRAVAEVAGEPGPAFESKVLHAVRRERKGRDDRGSAGWRLRPIRASVLAASVLVLTLVSALGLPASRQALAETLGPLLACPVRWTCIRTSSQGPVEAQATDNGYQVAISNSYDDGHLVIIPFQIIRAGGSTAPDEYLMAGAVKVIDSAGHALSLSNVNNGVAVERANDGPSAGSQLAITITQIEVAKKPAVGTTPRPAERSGPPHAPTNVHGTWTLNLKPKVGHRETLPTPKDVQVGSLAITFTSVEVSGQNVTVAIRIHGGLYDAYTAGPAATVLYGPDGQPAIDLGWRVPDGARWNGPGKGDVGPGPDGTWDFSRSWQLQSQPGTYRLVIHPVNGRQEERYIEVPHGLGAGVPNFTDPPFPG